MLKCLVSTEELVILTYISHIGHCYSLHSGFTLDFTYQQQKQHSAN